MLNKQAMMRIKANNQMVNSSLTNNHVINWITMNCETDDRQKKNKNKKYEEEEYILKICFFNKFIHRTIKQQSKSKHK